MITPYLRDMINDHKATEKVRKIQIIMHVNSISSKDTGETYIIYVLSYNEDIMQGSEAYNIIKELFEILLDNYQKEEQII